MREGRWCRCSTFVLFLFAGLAFSPLGECFSASGSGGSVGGLLKARRGEIRNGIQRNGVQAAFDRNDVVKYHLPSRSRGFSSASSSTRLNLAFTPASLISLTSGGAVAGGLHAVTGPDHLGALLPLVVGQRWYRSVKVGALWGLGHSLSGTLLGISAFLLKSKIAKTSKMFTLLSSASSLMEFFVGLSLVFIGVMGIREAKEWRENLSSPASSLSSAASPVNKSSLTNKSVLLNGILHGFSWDGTPSLAPAIIAQSMRGNILFLLSYAIGTTFAMSLAMTIVGEGTSRIDKDLNRPDIAPRICMGSSIAAVGVGIVWGGLGLRCLF